MNQLGYWAEKPAAIAMVITFLTSIQSIPFWVYLSLQYHIIM